MRPRTNWLWPVAILAAVALAFLVFRWVTSWFDVPAPTTIAQASLQSMREQQRLTAFSARYVAVVTSTQERVGGAFQAQKTLIMPGEVRYEVNLAALGEDDLRWSNADRLLTVTLPPLEISQPQIDINAIREIKNNSLLYTFTNAEQALDAANRQAALRSLTEQARSPTMLRLARDAAKRAVARSFALPLRAAGVEANVSVRFADEPQGEREYMDASTPLNEVMGRPVVVDEKK